MDGEIVGRGIELLHGVDGLGAAGDDLLVGEERVQGGDLHAEGLRLLADQPAHVAVGLDAQALALQLAAGGRGEVRAGHEDHQAEGEFRHGVGVLAGGVHHDDLRGGGGGQVDIVVAGARADDDLELRGGGDDLGRHLVGTDDDGVDIGHGGDEVALLGVFLQLHDLMAGFGENLHNPLHRLGGERLLGGK